MSSRGFQSYYRFIVVRKFELRDASVLKFMKTIEHLFDFSDSK